MLRGFVLRGFVLRGFVLRGSLSPKDAFAGLASPANITIALLLVVSQGVIETGLKQWVGPALFDIAPCGYRFSDDMKIGIPLGLLTVVVAVLAISSLTHAA